MRSGILCDMDGVKGTLAKLAKTPGDPSTGHYNEKLKVVTGLKMAITMLSTFLVVTLSGQAPEPKLR